MHKFAKILPESECGSRLRMVRWYYQTRFENGLMQKKQTAAAEKAEAARTAALKNGRVDGNGQKREEKMEMNSRTDQMDGMNTAKNVLPTTEHTVQFCVVGGGLAGLCAAVAAARRGISALLMQDRPVLGGNASSEIRMWVRGADGEDMRETGLVEELELENCCRNPDMNFSLWDSVLYGLARKEKNLTLLLNCSCLDAKTEDGRICSVIGWQLTTQRYHCVKAQIFADCSGDSILAPLTGAPYRMGREAQREYGEDIAPKQADSCTMGISCLIQARQTGHPVTFRAPDWAAHYTENDFPFRLDLSSPERWTGENFWWMELGGTKDTIRDTEEIRDELVKMALGVWDFIKNGGKTDASDWELDWMGFLPGKRESRRYEGAYILTQNDVRNEGRFEDLVAYGGWTMDDHNPSGFETKEKPNTFHPAPSPYGIPYRCLYSSAIKNLMFAGRNISATHTANSSTRVMATCAILGQAVGTAVALAIQAGKDPAGLYPEQIDQLQQELMKDGCYLPWHRLRPDAVMKGARITCGREPADILTDGLERRIDGIDHAWEGMPGDELILTLPEARYAGILRLVFDCDLNRKSWENAHWYLKRYAMKCNTFRDDQPVLVPQTIVRAFNVDVDEGDGIWKPILTETENYQYLQKIRIGRLIKRVRLICRQTWGSKTVRLYAMGLWEK